MHTKFSYKSCRDLDVWERCWILGNVGVHWIFLVQDRVKGVIKLKVP